MKPGWRLLGAALVLLGLAIPPGGARAVTALSAGEAIYLRGESGSGTSIEAARDAGPLRIKGREAACVNCHLHSGLGTTEGHTIIPPITGRYLFQPRATDHNQPDLPYVEGMHRDRDPYTDATLARAIREGVDSEGRTLGYLMPRFAMSDADMAALIGYLKNLDPVRLPGVTDTVLHFATIITPDADPVKRRGMLDVMEQYFKEKNTRVLRTLPHMHTSENTAYSKTMYMVNRRWQLHVWELAGPPDTWEGQLSRHLAAEPVFAAVSGLGGSNWAPVHGFCEHARLPCLFPNVEVPVAADGDFYSVYYSKGVLLEAQLIGERIGESSAGAPVRAVRQIYRRRDSGEAAARALAAALKGRGVAVHDDILPAVGEGEDVAAALGTVSKDEALVLWLRPKDIAALGEAPAAVGSVYLSGLMGGLENAPLPASWRGRAWLAYPFDLPDRRVVRVDYPLGWFSIRHIPVVAQQVQVDTYMACGLLAETLSHMVDTFVRDYLVERLEEDIEHRIMTGYYPRLTLAEGQRFASKGGYLVQFAGDKGTRLIAAHDWTVP
jgi:hypothetical protein